MAALPNLGAAVTAADHVRSYRRPIASDRFRENPPFKSSTRGWRALAVPMERMAWFPVNPL